MKIVVLQLPSILSDAEISEALQAMAAMLPVPNCVEDTMRVNILSDETQKPLNPLSKIMEKCDAILQVCIDPNQNNIASITNFWANISTGKITKGQLLEIMRSPSVAKSCLRKRNAECFYHLFENALKHL